MNNKTNFLYLRQALPTNTMHAKTTLLSDCKVGKQSALALVGSGLAPQIRLGRNCLVKTASLLAYKTTELLTTRHSA
jgi:hypothetical protein